MIFYKRMIGDIQAKTGHLTLSEFGAYDRLLDHYYSTEKGIPADRVNGIARAVSKEDRKAVEFVLSEFFILGEDGFYRQGKTEEMIAEAQPKMAAAKANGAKGGRPKKPKTETQQKPTGFLEETQQDSKTEPSGKASQSQSQNIDISKEVSLSHSLHPDASDSDFENLGGTTPAGEVCKALKRIGIASVSPSHPELLALLKKGVTLAMFEDAATKTVAKNKGFSYMLAIVTNQLQAAANIEAGPSVAAEAWDANRQTIEAMGVRLGMGKWDETAVINREQFSAYTARVRVAMEASRETVGA